MFAKLPTGATERIIRDGGGGGGSIITENANSKFELSR